MKIIYSGGWNKKSRTSVESSFVYTYRDTILKAVSDGKRICFVTMAKPDGYFNSMIEPLYGNKVDIINFASKITEWGKYDGIFIPGGETVQLKKGLVDKEFNMGLLKSDCVILGDSAGSYILSSYFFKSPKGERRGIDMEFLEGLNPDSSLITIAHRNNPVSCNDTLISNVKAFAAKKKLQVLILQENEQKMMQGTVFAEVDREKLFT